MPTSQVTVHGDRARDFERVFGTTTVPVRGWLPFLANLPGFEEPQLVYELDLEWVEREGHRPALVTFLAERFGMPVEEVDRDLEAIGLPILAADCVLVTKDMSWL